MIIRCVDTIGCGGWWDKEEEEEGNWLNDKALVEDEFEGVVC